MLCVNLTPRFSNCYICGKELIGPCKGVPIYEGCLVPIDWTKEWGGVDACDQCYDHYENNRFEYWPKNFQKPFDNGMNE